MKNAIDRNALEKRRNKKLLLDQKITIVDENTHKTTK